ncbi:MAG: PIN domain-containing protein [Planctomycetes bacterium]|nr:PIN domain-containing protein [Planctomycetota bacterium]
MFADTSGLIAWLVERDSCHVRAKEAMRRLAERGVRMLTSNYVFDELVSRVKRRCGAAEARRVGEIILMSRSIRREFVTEETEGAAWGLFLRYSDQEFSFTDATCVAIMRRHGIREVFTFDEGFRRVGLTMIPG